ncbi:uncharacterized protein Z518_02582 [Rhinocladiella mackenziei CBS 650.93]|uniref:Uncharacterized protein n=1 Tax=Rhinocladiella mackenziei CBS 650.93 TaxID=1442369 RepID=A0A0D2HBV4_9EURO|nr:uncharacterized protein Z518_02582 [Rhinocladiella mackenziei CBS 650.93]KIX07928.1 hypothetical protein Z518_02582 [Rhinocladiella mackenziei CBS 650.93]
MEWISSLKRTRTGSIYSETTSSLTKLDTYTLKRRKMSPGQAQRLSSPCHLEALPTELLQQIFLVSMNGNLITASPLIAIKLSGQTSVYRAAFLLAFFSHDVDKLFNIHKLHYMIPMLDLPPSSWDVRSMTRAVLNSRWCTWSQVKSWLVHNLKYAATRLLESAEPDNSRPQIEKFIQGRVDVDTLFGRCWWAKDEQSRSWQLEPDIFDIRLTRDADIYDDPLDQEADDDEDYMQDSFTAEWNTELILQCQMRIFGVVTIGEEKRQSHVPDFHDDDPFRRVVEEYSGLNIEKMKPQPLTLDFWQLLDERAVRATRNSHWLRETLAIDYFFSPEDQPYHVSPRLYRAAAAADLQLEHPMSCKRGSYVPVLYVLFSIDPLSLPKTDPILLAWAAKARSRVLDFHERLVVIRDLIEDLREEQHGTLRDRHRNRYRAIKLEYKYNYEMDLKILRYIKTGSLMMKVDTFAPDFAEPLGWLGERLNPSPEALAKAENADFPNAERWDVDIFNEALDDRLRFFYSVDQEQRLEGDLSFLGQDVMQPEADDLLDEAERDEARNALTAYDGYYRSWHHDDYHRLLVEYCDERDYDGNHRDFDEEEEEDGIDDDEPQEPANIHFVKEPREDWFRASDEDMAINWIVAYS